MPDASLPTLSVPHLRGRPRTADRLWLDLALLISGLVHALLLAIAILARHPPSLTPPEPDLPGFEMVFQGGERSPNAVPNPGRYIEIPNGAPVPAPPVATPPDSQMSPPQAEAAPEVNLLPPEMQMMAPPVAEPTQQASQAPAKIDRRPRQRTRTSPNNSPFAHPQEYSLSTGERRSVPTGLRGARGLDLSLGPAPRGGQLADGVPHFATPGLEGDYGERLNAYVESHKYYPEQAIANQEQGESVISATIDPDGRVRNVRLVGSSGSPSLDMAWVGLFRNLHLPPFPKSMTVKQLDFTYGIEYHLVYH